MDTTLDNSFSGKLNCASILLLAGLSRFNCVYAAYIMSTNAVFYLCFFTLHCMFIAGLAPEQRSFFFLGGGTKNFFPKFRSEDQNKKRSSLRKMCKVLQISWVKTKKKNFCRNVYANFYEFWT